MDFIKANNHVKLNMDVFVFFYNLSYVFSNIHIFLNVAIKLFFSFSCKINDTVQLLIIIIIIIYLGRREVISHVVPPATKPRFCYKYRSDRRSRSSIFSEHFSCFRNGWLLKLTVKTSNYRNYVGYI